MEIGGLWQIKELTLEPYRVLMVLFGKLDFENWIAVQQKEIADQVDIQKSNVSRAIKLLERKEILLRGPKLGKSYAYRLNPHYGWKGKSKKLQKKLQNARLELVKG